MKLREQFGIAANHVILVGKPEATNFVSSDGETYFVVKTKTPVRVTCSVDKNIPAYETSEVYIRESALDLDDWKAVDPEKSEEGFYMEGWKVDFSKSQEIPILQETTIAQWFNDGRKTKKAENDNRIIQNIKNRLANK